MKLNETRIVAIIPVHLASVRFPRKALINIKNLPMVEHVRRRALMSFNPNDVYIATCDDEIVNVLSKYDSNIIKTSNQHKNGTSRVAEAIKNIDCTHVILLQGDEPLLLPSHVDELKKSINTNPNGVSWNITGPLNSEDELDRSSYVKCITTISNRIIFCFRRSPLISTFEINKKYVSKIHGIIAYRKDFLIDLIKMPLSNLEKSESIEQMRIIENGYVLNSVRVNSSIESINEPHELDKVLRIMDTDDNQNKILREIMK